MGEKMGPILRVQKRVQKNRVAAAASNVQCLVQTSANFTQMLDALLSGRLIGTPQKRLAKSGQPFAGARVRVSMHDGAVIVVSVTAFEPEPMAALLVMSEGDAVSITGPLTLGTWTDNEGLQRPSAAMLAHNVLTAYSVNKKRKAQPEAMPVPSPGKVGDLF